MNITFHPDVPQNIHAFLNAILGPWIDRRQSRLFSFETMRYGLVTFSRDPWPIAGDVTVIEPAGEVDLAAVQSFSATF